MTLKNELCRLLGIEYPIIEGGLAYVGNGLLAAAVSEGGGFGQVGAGGRTPENFAEQIRIAAAHTDKPFGVNVPLSMHQDLSRYFEVIKENRNRIKAVSLGAGNPKPWIPFLKQLGILVMVMTSTVRHARSAEAAGANIVICEGYEAGGKNGPAELTTMALVPQVARAVSVPVVAAGGIADGRGMAAALALGAQGVQMGTRFVATIECEAHERYKKILVEAGDDSTLIMSRALGSSVRVYRNAYAEKVQEMERQNPDPEKLRPYVSGAANAKAAIHGDFENGYVNAGQSTGLIDGIESAAAVVKKVAGEAETVIRSMYESVAGGQT